ncbi:MAG: hypothetical protein ACPGJV_09925 [Bacteriovoracaceae bacterium]
MKKLLLALTLLTSTQTFAQIDDKVTELTNSGTPDFTKDSSVCKSRFEDEGLTDQLGNSSNPWNSICVKRINLPYDVLQEVREMKRYEDTNESDYDSRVTRLYVFKSRYKAQAGLGTEGTKKLTDALGIPASQTKAGHVSAFIGESRHVDRFNNLHLNDMDYSEETKIAKYLETQIKGKLVLHIQFSDGIELYPGGGMYVDHHIFLVEGKIIYVKSTWWDA